jgi:hypothetical protein
MVHIGMVAGIPETAVGIGRAGVWPGIYTHSHVPAVVDVNIGVPPVDVCIVPVSRVNVAGIGIVSCAVARINVPGSCAGLLTSA